MIQLRTAVILLFLTILASAARAADAPIEVRVVVVTAFEIGADTGDKAGEYQAWAQNMPDVLPFPVGFRHLRYDPKNKTLLLSTGVGTNRAAASVMALGQDPRFDLSHAYWLVAAIAGVNPNTASVGSAAWIGNVVDTDYGYAIDLREAPAGWSTGFLPRDRARPYQAPRADPEYNLFPLNTALRDWAYARTRKIAIPDTPTMKQIRSHYGDYPAALAPPSVIRGDEASGQTFWHGAILNAHTEQWVAYWTGRPASFVMTAMEDTGVANALMMLGRVGKADPLRLLVLRTGSNYSLPPKGTGAAESLAAEASSLSAMQPSLDAAFMIGAPIVAELSGHWDLYRKTIAGSDVTATRSVSAP